MEICLVWVQSAAGVEASGVPAWDDAAELKHFDELAADHPVVMGRGTWESLSGGLPGRQNIVLSSHKLALKGAMHCETLPEALTMAAVLKPSKVFLIGGAGLYEKARRIADRVYVARIGAEGETSSPDIDPRQFALADKIARKHESRMPIVVEEYRRLRSTIH